MTLIKFLNKNNLCIVCFKKKEKDFKLMKHHVSYFPEIIAYVHYHCHLLIHDPENPITNLIQYNKGDSRKFYSKK